MSNPAPTQTQSPSPASASSSTLIISSPSSSYILSKSTLNNSSSDVELHTVPIPSLTPCNPPATPQPANMSFASLTAHARAHGHVITQREPMDVRVYPTGLGVGQTQGRGNEGEEAKMSARGFVQPHRSHLPRRVRAKPRSAVVGIELERHKEGTKGDAEGETSLRNNNEQTPLMPPPPALGSDSASITFPHPSPVPSINSITHQPAAQTHPENTSQTRKETQSSSLDSSASWSSPTVFDPSTPALLQQASSTLPQMASAAAYRTPPPPAFSNTGTPVSASASGQTLGPRLRASLPRRVSKKGVVRKGTVTTGTPLRGVLRVLDDDSSSTSSAEGGRRLMPVLSSPAEGPPTPPPPTAAAEAPPSLLPPAAPKTTVDRRPTPLTSTPVPLIPYSSSSTAVAGTPAKMRNKNKRATFAPLPLAVSPPSLSPRYTSGGSAIKDPACAGCTGVGVDARTGSRAEAGGDDASAGDKEAGLNTPGSGAGAARLTIGVRRCTHTDSAKSEAKRGARSPGSSRRKRRVEDSDTDSIPRARWVQYLGEGVEVGVVDSDDVREPIQPAPGDGHRDADEMERMRKVVLRVLYDGEEDMHGGEGVLEGEMEEGPGEISADDEKMKVGEQEGDTQLGATRPESQSLILTLPTPGSEERIEEVYNSNSHSHSGSQLQSESEEQTHECPLYADGTTALTAEQMRTAWLWMRGWLWMGVGAGEEGDEHEHDDDDDDECGEEDVRQSRSRTRNVPGLATAHKHNDRQQSGKGTQVPPPPHRRIRIRVLAARERREDALSLALGYLALCRTGDRVLLEEEEEESEADVLADSHAEDRMEEDVDGLKPGDPDKYTDVHRIWMRMMDVGVEEKGVEAEEDIWRRRRASRSRSRMRSRSRSQRRRGAGQRSLSRARDGDGSGGFVDILGDVSDDDEGAEKDSVHDQDKSSKDGVREDEEKYAQVEEQATRRVEDDRPPSGYEDEYANDYKFDAADVDGDVDGDNADDDEYGYNDPYGYGADDIGDFDLNINVGVRPQIKLNAHENSPVPPPPFEPHISSANSNPNPTDGLLPIPIHNASLSQNAPQPVSNAYPFSNISTKPLAAVHAPYAPAHDLNQHADANDNTEPYNDGRGKIHKHLHGHREHDYEYGADGIRDEWRGVLSYDGLERVANAVRGFEFEFQGMGRSKGECS